MSLLAIYFVNLPVAVTGAFLLMAVVRLGCLMRARRAEHARARVVDEVVAAAEEERVRVADRLHDGPIQQLTALALTLDLMNLQLDRGDLSALRGTVGQARSTVTDQMLALRRLMGELRPLALYETELDGAPRGYTSELEAEAA